MAIGGGDGAHLGVGQAIGIGDDRRGIAAIRRGGKDADEMNLDRLHLSGVDEVSTGSLRLDQSWNEPS